MHYLVGIFTHLVRFVQWIRHVKVFFEILCDVLSGVIGVHRGVYHLWSRPDPELYWIGISEHAGKK